MEVYGMDYKKMFLELTLEEKLQVFKELSADESVTEEDLSAMINAAANYEIKEKLASGKSVDIATEEVITEYQDLFDTFEIRRVTQQDKIADSEDGIGSVVRSYVPKKMIIADPTISTPLFVNGSNQVAHRTHEVTALFQIHYDRIEDDDKVTGLGKLTPFDKKCLDAITTLYANGNRVISLSQIYRVMCINQNTRQKLRSDTRDAIKASISKMIGSLTTVNAQEAHSAQKIELRQALLTGVFRKMTFANGTVEECLYLPVPPVLYQYSRLVNEVSVIPLDVIDTGARNSVQELNLASYLELQINYANARSTSCLIDLSQCYYYYYSNLDEFNPEGRKTLKARARKYIKQILDNWIQTKYIKSYSFEKMDKSDIRAYSHIRIETNDVLQTIQNKDFAKTLIEG